MKPGRDLDAQVAEKVMRQIVGKEIFDSGEEYVVASLHKPTTEDLPPYSTDLRAAILASEHLKQKHRYFLTLNFTRFDEKSAYEAVFTDVVGQAISKSYGVTPEHAICLAALLAVK